MATDREIAVQQQEKLQFYVVALVFTLLAASVQTAKLGANVFHDAVELAGWCCLLASGIGGLWYLESGPVIRVKMADLDQYREELTRFLQHAATGQSSIFVAAQQRMQPVQPFIDNRKQAVALLEQLIPKLERRLGWKYTTFRFGFVIGLTLIAVSRAIPAFLSGTPGLAV